MAIIRHASSFKSGLDESERLLIVIRRRLYRTHAYALSDKIAVNVGRGNTAHVP